MPAKYCIWKCLFNINIEANIVDPDQTAPTGAVWSGSPLFVYEASNILVEDKNIHVIMRFNLFLFCCFTSQVNTPRYEYLSYRLYSAKSSVILNKLYNDFFSVKLTSFVHLVLRIMLKMGGVPVFIGIDSVKENKLLFLHAQCQDPIVVWLFREIYQNIPSTCSFWATCIEFFANL